MDRARTYDEVIVFETLRRKDVILDLSGSRNPDANARKQRAWKVAEAVLLECKRLMTVPQVKRVWRNKKTHVREMLLRERRYREATGGGIDLGMEKSIPRATASFTEAEAELVRTLGHQAVMAGLRKFESFVDKTSRDDSGSSQESIGIWTVGGLVGGLRGRSGLTGEGGGKEGNNSLIAVRAGNVRFERQLSRRGRNRAEQAEGWWEGLLEGGGRREGGRAKTPSLITPDELEEIRRKRILRQLSDFDSDSSTPPEKKRRASETEVCRLQMELLKEERAIFTKISVAVESSSPCLTTN